MYISQHILMCMASPCDAHMYHTRCSQPCQTLVPVMQETVLLTCCDPFHPYIPICKSGMLLCRASLM